MVIVQTLTQRLGQSPQELWERSHGGKCGTLSHTEACGDTSHTEGYMGTSLTQELWGHLSHRGMHGTLPHGEGCVGPSLTRRDVSDLPSHRGIYGTLPHTGAEGIPPHTGALGTPLTGRDVWDSPSHCGCGTLSRTEGYVGPSLTQGLWGRLSAELCGLRAGSGPGCEGGSGRAGALPTRARRFPRSAAMAGAARRGGSAVYRSRDPAVYRSRDPVRNLRLR